MRVSGSFDSTGSAFLLLRFFAGLSNHDLHKGGVCPVNSMADRRSFSFRTDRYQHDSLLVGLPSLLPWAEFFSENYMTNRERLQLVHIKVKVIKYPGENYAIFGKNEIVKILLRKAKGEKVKYNAA